MSKIWTTTRYRERVSFDRYPIVSVARLSVNGVLLLLNGVWHRNFIYAKDFDITHIQEVTMYWLDDSPGYTYNALVYRNWTTWHDDRRSGRYGTNNDTQVDGPWRDGLTMFCLSISTHTPGQIDGPKEKHSVIPRWYSFAKDLPTLSSGMEFQLRIASARLYIYLSTRQSKWTKCYTNTAWLTHEWTRTPLGCSHIIPKIVPRGSTGYIWWRTLRQIKSALQR